MKWEVRGAHRETGQELSSVYEADSQAQAETLAKRDGLLIGSIRPYDPFSPALQKRTATASPHIDGSDRPSCILIGGVFVALGLIGLFFSIVAIYFEKFGTQAPADPMMAIRAIAQQQENILLFTLSAIASFFSIGFGSLLSAVGTYVHIMPSLVREIAQRPVAQ